MSLPGRATYDAIVVGAGPAGAQLSYLLARGGRRVALLDRQRFPREKVCGGGLSRKAAALLDVDVGSVAHNWLTGAFLTCRNAGAIVMDLPVAAGCTLLRADFDELLLTRACDAGVEFFAETAFHGMREDRDTVTAETSRGEFSGRRLFGADGVASPVRTRVFGRRLVAYVPALEALVHVSGADLARFRDRALFDFGGMPGGYGWIFPKRDHLNVGIYSPFGSRRLRAHLRAFIERYPALRRARNIEHRGYAIPVSNRRGVFEHGAVSLVGDAAGLVESVFGEGIYFALKSATLAAQAELAGQDGAQAGHYTRLLKRELLPELRAARILASGLFGFQRFAFSHLVCNDGINPLFAGLITGDTGYRECLRATTLAAHSWLWRPAPSPRLVIP